MNGLGSYVAFILGGSMELALDPLDIGIGLLLGFAATRWWQRAVASIAFAVLLSVVVRTTSTFPNDVPLWWTIACRSLATFAWAIVGWAVRSMTKRLKLA